MPRRPDILCAGQCGRLLWRSKTSLDAPTCHECRRARRQASAPRQCWWCHTEMPAERSPGGRLWRRCIDCRTRSCNACDTSFDPKSVDQMSCSIQCAGQHQAARARDARLPVLHPNPDPLTHIPLRHPLRRPLPPRPRRGWSFLVSGPCSWCSEHFTTGASGTDPACFPKFCSPACAKNAARERSGRFRIRPTVRQSIYERDGWQCQLCGDAVDPDLPSSDPWAATLDHIECQSWVLIPDHSPSNLRLAHRWCNSARGDGRSAFAA